MSLTCCEEDSCPVSRSMSILGNVMHKFRRGARLFKVISSYNLIPGHSAPDEAVADIYYQVITSARHVS